MAKIRQMSPIWIVPFLAVAIGLWMLYYTQTNQGPVITLYTPNAEGIVAGKTQIKNRSVDVGRVESVQLSEDLTQVVVKAKMDPGTEGLLNADTVLWVVKPTVGRGGVSGLSTLLSGAYIELQPGFLTEESKYDYDLLESPPVAPADAAGVRVKLISQDASALSVGDPVLYRGYAVGTVESSEFDAKAGQMRYQLFVRAPYDSLVTQNVRFWKTSGMALDLSAQGVRVELSSIATLLSGGVNFDVLEGWPAGRVVEHNQEFLLFESQKSIQEGLYTEYLEYLLLFDESIRGLTAGAPIEYKGIRVGTVVMAPYFVKLKDPLELAFSRGIPVLVRLEVGRMVGDLNLKEMEAELETAVKRGLRASLKTGSLLTGALYVELVRTEEAWPEDKPFSLASLVGYKILPTTSSGLANIEQKVLQVLDKVNALPVESVLEQSEQTLAQSEVMLKNADALLRSLDAIVNEPGTKALPADLQATLVDVRRALAGFSPGAPAYEKLNSNLQAMDQLLRDLQPVIKTMHNQSNALIFSADKPQDPQPEAKK